MRFIKEQARKARKDGCRIFTIMHHGLVRHWTWQDLAMSDYLVKGWKKDSRIFGRLGLNVVFTGLMNDSRLDAKALEYARSVISSVVEEMIPYSYMERLDAAARKVRRYSPKYAFILRHIGRYLYTDTGMEDNNATIHIGR